MHAPFNLRAHALLTPMGSKCKRCGERCTCKRHTVRRHGLVATWRCHARRMRMFARARGRAHTHPHARRVRTIARHVVKVERTSLRSRTMHSKPRVFGTLATHVCGCVGAGSGTNAAARRCARQHRWCCHADVASATTRRHQRQVGGKSAHLVCVGAQNYVCLTSVPMRLTPTCCW